VTVGERNARAGSLARHALFLLALPLVGFLDVREVGVEGPRKLALDRLGRMVRDVRRDVQARAPDDVSQIDCERALRNPLLVARHVVAA
jgi:hypothetical protein